MSENNLSSGHSKSGSSDTEESIDANFSKDIQKKVEITITGSREEVKDSSSEDDDN